MPVPVCNKLVGKACMYYLSTSRVLGLGSLEKRGVGVAESDWGNAFSSFPIPKISDAKILVWEQS